VTRIDPGVVSLVADLRGHERPAAEDWASGNAASRSASSVRRIRRRRNRWDVIVVDQGYLSGVPNRFAHVLEHCGAGVVENFNKYRVN
jgi:hypothetical protein